MHHYISILLFILLSGVSSCENPSKQLERYQQEIIEIHDEVMPITMGSIPKLKNRLKASLEENPDTIVVYDLINSLNEADEAMMVWMDEWRGVDEELDYEANMKHLQSEMNKILKVKNETNLAVNSAEEYLNKK